MSYCLFLICSIRDDLLLSSVLYTERGEGWMGRGETRRFDFAKQALRVSTLRITVIPHIDDNGYDIFGRVVAILLKYLETG